MSFSQQRRTQKLTIIAQDPSVRVRRKNPRTNAVELAILTAQVDLPAEELAPGPRGYRVQVIDYDSSTGVLYPPLEYRLLGDGQYNDPFAGEPDAVMLGDPGFHQQNVYAIIMRTLTRFEYALGRRVGWSFEGHQLQVAPHAFAEANAFYSPEDRALLFGYFPRVSGADEASEMVFTCLSHDVVVHETTHALVDGLRERFTDASSPDQAAFHEGFADLVALLSIFSLPQVVETTIDLHFNECFGQDAAAPDDDQLISVKHLTIEALRNSLLLGLAEEMGEELSGVRRKALRRSVKLDELDPKPNINEPSFIEPHKRGELLVAVMMNAFLQVWVKRLEGLGSRRGEPAARRKRQKDWKPRRDSEYLDRRRVVEEGAAIADYLLTMAIRALDYTPPCDLKFSDYLSALLTADREIRPDDSKYRFRATLFDSFRAYGIETTSRTADGVWEAPDTEFHYARVHHESMLRDPDEMFRFIWENRAALGLEAEAFTKVLSVRPCVRLNPDDGFVLRETVAEYHQILSLQAAELKHVGIKTPAEMQPQQEVTIYGGGALIFDEFGRVKFHIRNRLLSPERQTRRLEYLWQMGAFDPRHAFHEGTSAAKRFDEMHRQRFGLFPFAPESRDAENWEP
jgi:hypothetical protein